MKSIYARFLGAFLGLAAFAAAAHGQAADQVVVDIPYDFVASGKTLPAGTYKITRVNHLSPNQLVLTNAKTGSGVLLLADLLEQARDEQPRLAFEVVGGQHVLSSIETADHIFRFPLSASAAAVVAKRQNAPSSSGTSGTSGSN